MTTNLISNPAIWLTTGSEATHDEVSHAASTCEDLQAAVAAGAVIRVETEPSGWLCEGCVEVQVGGTPKIAGDVERSTYRGPSASSAPVNKVPDMTLAEIETWLSGLGRKVEFSEVKPEMVAAVTEWAKGYEGTFEFMLDMRKAATRKPLTIGQTKGTLNCLRADIARRPAAKPAQGTSAPKIERKVVTEDGMYQDPEGNIFKVQVAKQGSGNLYAKRLDVEMGKFEYERGLLYKINPDWKMSLEAAKAFGQLYGFCCVCARDLTDETSIAEGIGPVCAGRF